MDTQRFQKETAILDYTSPTIAQLVEQRGWKKLDTFERIGAIYLFVRDEILFGYNASDDIPASQVLADGYGQCNTKGSLLMALLRASGIACRFHGFTINNALQKGAIPPFLMPLAPRYILHSWVEVWFRERWVCLEGFILDKAYLMSIQKRFSEISQDFCGYGVATTCLAKPPIDWEGSDTYIQKEGIHDDFGVFDDPDAFFLEKGANLSGVKKFFFRFLFRHLINRNVRNIRGV